MDKRLQEVTADNEHLMEEIRFLVQEKTEIKDELDQTRHKLETIVHIQRISSHKKPQKIESIPLSEELRYDESEEEKEGPLRFHLPTESSQPQRVDTNQSHILDSSKCLGKELLNDFNEVDLNEGAAQQSMISNRIDLTTYYRYESPTSTPPGDPLSYRDL